MQDALDLLRKALEASQIALQAENDRFRRGRYKTIIRKIETAINEAESVLNKEGEDRE